MSNNASQIVHKLQLLRIQDGNDARMRRLYLSREFEFVWA